MPYQKQEVELKSSSLREFNDALKADRTQSMVVTALRGNADEYFRNIASLVANNPDLQKCEPTSLICGGLQAANLKLPLGAGLGFAYIIPYQNRKRGIYEAQFQIG